MKAEIAALEAAQIERRLDRLDMFDTWERRDIMYLVTLYGTYTPESVVRAVKHVCPLITRDGINAVEKAM